MSNGEEKMGLRDKKWGPRNKFQFCMQWTDLLSALMIRIESM